MADTTTPSFNLWTLPWIDLEKQDGTIERTGIGKVLLHAEVYRAIFSPSPLTIVGIHRLLMAILQFAYKPGKSSDIKKLWAEGKFFPDPIEAFSQQFSSRFDLFSVKEPFMQSADIPIAADRSTAKPVTYLAPEIPAGTGITHYCHGDEDDQVFCPACAAHGLVTIPAFATSGGAGIKPSINGVPPIYILPGGSNLFESLAASLVLPAYQPQIASRLVDNAWWIREPVVERSSSCNEVGYLHSLTFPARRVRLHPEKLTKRCSRCNAESEWGVRQMVFEMGESRPKEAAFWFDPFAAYKIGRDKPIPFRPVNGKALWREFASLFLLSNGNDQSGIRRPTILEQIAGLELLSDLVVYPFRCIGMRTDMKAKVFEWMEAGFEIPPRILNDVGAGIEVRQATDFATECSQIICRTFRQNFGGKSKKSERNKSLKTRMENGYWSALAEPFRKTVLKMADLRIRDQARQEWADHVQVQAHIAFRKTIESLGDNAENLSKGAIAEKWCNIHLANKRKEYLNE